MAVDALLVILFVISLFSPLLCRLDWGGAVAGLGACAVFLLAAPVYAGGLGDADKAVLYGMMWLTIAVLGVDVFIIILRVLGRTKRHPLGLGLED